MISITTKELASTLNGREYLHELSTDDADFATENNLVVIYIDMGLFEVRGVLKDTIKCYNGLTIYLDPEGIQTTVDSECYQTCELYRNMLKSYKQITPIWVDEGRNKGSYWKFETDIPHETFKIFKDGDLDCIGVVLSLDDLKGDLGKISDGYHTFDELYYHRMILFSIICNTYPEKSWKSWLHADGTMYDDYFIVGVTTPEGDYSYHYHMDYWDKFKVPELEHAPEWDGYQPGDIGRLESLLKT